MKAQTCFGGRSSALEGHDAEDKVDVLVGTRFACWYDRARHRIYPGLSQKNPNRR